MTRRRRRALLLGAGAVAVAAVVVVVLWNRDTARSVSVDEAQRRLGSTTSTDAGSQPTDGLLRPAAGVYRYRGEGTDSIHTPPKSQAEGPDMPATVTHRDDGCWEFRIDYSTNHWQTWDYCAHDGTLDERGGQTYQRWDFVVLTNESTTTFECDSSVTIRPRQRPGDEWEQRCHDRDHPDTVSAGPYRYVGREVLRVGDAEVPAFRYHRERTMSGGQTGSERSDVWFSVDTGLPLRNERSIDVETSTAIGDVRYTEEASFEATSIDPV